MWYLCRCLAEGCRGNETSLTVLGPNVRCSLRMPAGEIPATRCCNNCEPKAEAAYAAAEYTKARVDVQRVVDFTPSEYQRAS